MHGGDHNRTATWRGRTVLLAMAASLVLAACGGSGLFGASKRQQIITYEALLRSEADYLWAAMNYAHQY